MGAPTNKELADRLLKIAKQIHNEKVKRTLEVSAVRLTMPGHKRTRTHGNRVVYTVWDNRIDKCIAFELPGKECAHRMGIEYNSFMTAIARGSDRWTIEKRFADEEP